MVGGGGVAVACGGRLVVQAAYATCHAAPAPPLARRTAQARRRPSSSSSSSSSYPHKSFHSLSPSHSSHMETTSIRRRRRSRAVSSSTATVMMSSSVVAASEVCVMVNDCSGRMGHAVAEAAVEAGLTLVPHAITGGSDSVVACGGVAVRCKNAKHKEEVIRAVRDEYPNVVVVDFTLPAAVNENADFYVQHKVPFVMGTTGGDRARLMRNVQESGVYAVVAPQMGKQVVAFQAAMSIMADNFPGAFKGYALHVTESHQSTKVDTSGTAKAIVASFQKLGVEFDVEEIEMVRDPVEQQERMKVPQEHLTGHAFHTYQLVAPDGSVTFEFQHNVCGRSIYAQGTVDAVLFLHQRIKEGAEKKIYDMVDVLRAGAMR
eukprot:jgi/Chlat1/1174/Chrsp113S01644